MAKSRKDIYSEITNKMISSLKSGTVPWKKNWQSSLPKNLSTDKEYRGINLLILMNTDFGTPYWMTFKQAKSLGGSIRKGEKGTRIVFWKLVEKGEDDEFAKFAIIRQYTVFNLDQTEGIEKPVEEEKNLSCEKVVENYPLPQPSFRFGKPSYSPKRDVVSIPNISDFNSSDDYYSTLFHELAHSTGHKERLDRGFEDSSLSFGSEDYSKEELIAEFSSSFICAKVGIETNFDNSASYIASWLKVLKKDPKIVVQAAQKAQKVADFILGKEW